MASKSRARSLGNTAEDGEVFFTYKYTLVHFFCIFNFGIIRRIMLLSLHSKRKLGLFLYSPARSFVEGSIVVLRYSMQVTGTVW